MAKYMKEEKLQFAREAQQKAMMFYASAELVSPGVQYLFNEQGDRWAREAAMWYRYARESQWGAIPTALMCMSCDMHPRAHKSRHCEHCNAEFAVGA